MDPLAELARWIEEARSREVEPDAMIVASVSKDGAPSVRVVLCRGVDGTGVRFFTNYESRKGGELAGNPKASAVFFFPNLKRQARIEGTIEKLSAEDSDAYFAHRPRGHQLSAWASDQSRPIGSLAEVQAKYAALEKKYEGKPVPRPPHWGGYQLTAARLELWESGENRLHTRRAYARSPQGWSQTLLSP